MLLKLLGLVDLAMASVIALESLGLPITRIYFAVALAHATKAAVFIKDVLSIIDISIAIYTLVLPFYHNSLISAVCVAFLLFKGAYSFA